MDTTYWIGVDVSKKWLDACALAGDAKVVESRFDNDAKGISRLLAWAKKLGEVSGIGMESTGGYELDLAIESLEKGFTTSVENPRRIKDFARAMGHLNKTDRADAKAIAEYLQRVGPSKWRLADPLVRELSGLTRHRGSLVGQCNRVLNRLGHRSHLPKLVIEQLKAELVRLRADIGAVDTARLELVAQSETLTRDLEVLAKVGGVGTITAMLVLSEAGDVDDFAQASSYAAQSGTQPCRRESGQWKGKSGISKCGNAFLRGGLMMPASVAARYNPVIKAFYQNLIAKGKTKMQALVACMRKLLMICYGVLKAVRQGKTPYYGPKKKEAETAAT